MIIKKSIRKLIILLCLIYGSHLHAQHRVSGVVINDSNGRAMIGVTVTFYNDDLLPVSYTRTDHHGSYSLMLPDSSGIVLKFSALGFEMQEKMISKNERDEGKVAPVYMKEIEFRLDEVIIQSHSPFRQVGDTLIFLADSYRKGDEQVIADLLKQLPGFQVDEVGTIRIGQQEIEKIMVEGDDFFNKAYPILSKSMPAYPILTVEVLNNYSENPLLKDMESSNKIALNLTLSDEYKRIWFGNVLAGAGYHSKTPYELRSEIMNFGKVNKYFMTMDVNNTGRLASHWADLLMAPPDDESVLGKGIKTIGQLLPDELDGPDSKGKRSKMTQAETVSMNGITNLSDTWKIKALSLFNRERVNSSEQIHEWMMDKDIYYDRNEDLSRGLKELDGFGQIELVGDWSHRSMFRSSTKLRIANQGNQLYSTINAQSTAEFEEIKTAGLEQLINFSTKLTSNSVLVFDGRIHMGRTPEYYFREDFSLNRSERYQHMGASLKLLSKSSNSLLWDIEWGILNKNDQYHLTALRPDSLWNLSLNSTSEFKPKYQVFEWYTQANYTKKFGSLELRGRLKLFHHSYGVTQNGHVSDHVGSNEFLRVNPRLSFGWNFTNDHRMSMGYSYSHAGNEAHHFFPIYSRKDYRSAERGATHPDFSELSMWTVNYYFNDWSSGLFIHSLGYLAHFHKTLSTKTQLNPLFTWSEKIWVNDPYLISFQSGMDYFLEPLSSNIKLNFWWNYSKNYIQFNTESLNEYQNESYQYQIEFRSAFTSMFNFHLGAKRSHSQNLSGAGSGTRLKSQENFVDVYLRSQNNWRISSELEWYFSDQDLNRQNHMLFVNANFQYRFKQDRFSLDLVGENLLDSKYLDQITVSEHAYYHLRKFLMPRRVLIRFSCRI